MARIITKTIRVINGMNLVNHYSDGTKDVNTFFVDDEVESLKYVEKEEMKEVSGRISSILTAFKTATRKSFLKNESYLDKDAIVVNITIDNSEKKKASLVTIPAPELLEFNPAEGKEVVKVTFDPEMKVKVHIAYSDETTSEIIFEEGQDLYGFKLKKGNKIIKGDFRVASFIYNINSLGKVEVTGLKLVEDSNVFIVLIDDIIDCGEAGVVLQEGESLTEALAEITEGGVAVPAGIIEEEITLANTVTIKGALTGVSAAKDGRCTDIIAGNETVLNKAITVSDDSDITLDGLALTSESLVNLKNAKSLTIKNCKFVDVEPTSNRTDLINSVHSTSEEDEILVIIKDTYFGTNPSDDTNRLYNLINIEARIADGSKIENCYFAESCCTHNNINLYEIAEGATITIANNTFEKSSNGIRLGFRGTPKCKVIIEGNTYITTDENPDYQGILLVQPYGQSTETFAETVIELNKNVAKCGGPLYYIYSGDSDTEMTEETAPKIFIDGVEEVSPRIIH